MASSSSQSNKQYLVVAAIDIGTSNCGYAYSTHKDIQDICTSNEFVAGRWMARFPCCILFDKNKTFVALGNEAEEIYNSSVGTDEETNYLLYRRFKMALYNEKDINENLQIKSVNGTSMLAIDVFSCAIRSIKATILQMLNETNTVKEIYVSDIRWVVTVPAIWTEKSKYFMRRVAIKAGIPTGDVLIGLEPECASLYTHSTLNKELHVVDAIKKPGTRQMVVDIGGGTIDIAFHEVLEENNLKEYHRVEGSDFGATKVDELFEEYLIDVLTDTAIERVRTKYPLDWFQLVNQFENIKRNIGNKRVKPMLLLQKSFLESYEAFNEFTLENAIANNLLENKRIKLNRNNYLEIPLEDIENMFRHITTKICNLITKLLQKPKLEKTDFIVLAGGFSESPILLNEIKKSANNIPIIRPRNAELSIVKGAVLFGWNPTKIISRVARKTYGVECREAFREGVDPEEFAVHSDQRGKRCEHKFYCFVKINETIIAGEKRKGIFYPDDSNSTKDMPKIYASEKDDITYTTEDGVDLIATLTLNMPNTTGGINREIECSMYFGETEIKFEAKDVTSGNVVTTNIDFL